MSWTEPLHVANLIQLHIHGVALGANQIQTEPDDIISEPLTLLELISKHRISSLSLQTSSYRPWSKPLRSLKKNRINDQYVQQLKELDMSELTNYMNSRGNVEV